MDHVGHVIRQAREERELTQTQLAALVGTGPSAISEIEHGKRNPNAATLMKLARALDVEVADLFPKAWAPRPSLDDSPEQRRIVHAFILQRAEWPTSLEERMNGFLKSLPPHPNSEELRETKARIAQFADEFSAMQDGLRKHNFGESLKPYIDVRAIDEAIEEGYEWARSYSHEELNDLRDRTPEAVWKAIRGLHAAPREISKSLINAIEWVRTESDQLQSFAEWGEELEKKAKEAKAIELLR
jgi:transcriptional regulator with XRE-family HTH domain